MKESNNLLPRKSLSGAATRRSSISKTPQALKLDQVYAACDESKFKFKSTKDIKVANDVITQGRAVRAINVGLGIDKPGYNIYVAGVYGTGKTSIIKEHMLRFSKKRISPEDWVYVYNFDKPEIPTAISMASGTARKFAKEMDAAIKALASDIPNALQSEDYENAMNSYLSQSNEIQAQMFADLERLAKERNFQIKSTRVGIETIPIVEGRPLTEKEYGKLSEEDRNDVEARRQALEPEVLEFARKVRAVESETKKYIDSLQEEIGKQVTEMVLAPIKEAHSGSEIISKYLLALQNEVVENLLDFVDAEEPHGEEEMHYLPMADKKEKFKKYKVNVFIDNKDTDGAPVIIENNPTYYNMFGKIEKNVEHGMYMTDFTMISAGAIHKANGGYLVLNANDVFKTPAVWESLKRVLKTRLGYIEDMGEQFSLLPTSGLRPDPIPLDVKVILIGNDEIYRLLNAYDEDFEKIFKIKAEFDHEMVRNSENIKSYVSFIAKRSSKEGLLPFSNSGVAAIVEHGSRLVDHQSKLSCQFAKLKDLTIESDFIAREGGAKTVKREHIEESLRQQEHRVNLSQEHLNDMIKEEGILLDVSGNVVGQVNGLAVYDMGDHSFGKPAKITCTSTFTHGGLINVERAAKLSGNIHDKGVYINSGFISHLLAKRHKLGFTANIVFEQNYGIVDGDSATAAELVAILSSVSNIPVRQDFAVTGSLNQFGDVQPIGGVNEKVEGFFATAQLLGCKNPVHVIIPYQNQVNLMLSPQAREGVKKGLLKIYPVQYFSEVFELMTGVPFGIHSINEEKFSKGSVLEKISNKLEEIRKEEETESEKEDTKPKKKSVAKKISKKKVTKKKVTKKKASKKRTSKKKTSKKKTSKKKK